MVVQMNVMLHPLPCLTGTTVLVDINIFIFQTALEALDNNVVFGPTFSVHADANIFPLSKSLYFGLVKSLPWSLFTIVGWTRPNARFIVSRAKPISWI